MIFYHCPTILSFVNVPTFFPFIIKSYSGKLIVLLPLFAGIDSTACSFHNSPLNAYYKKKCEQCKHHLTATGAVARLSFKPVGGEA
ncbi:hypothetical protein DWY37_15300 [Roseburia sp. AF25-13LB]|nr:hypothetical protein DWY43_14790 [Roseburia sp. AF25-18LB]RHQ45463.1 hypothetical protein DWY39_14800 [Roseburia sp. AF25-15LB]RHQ45533.1 hypothetical protein DWY37_15300 [Roseburia sp. AF25-13LB]